MLLYPQLPHPCAVDLAFSFRTVPVEELVARVGLEHAQAVYTPTGGNRADSAHLADLRNALLERAREARYPEAATEEQRVTFDQAAAIILHERMQLEPAEAAKPGVWEFICCVLACDLVRWRFPGTPPSGTGPDRFLSGRRNVFRRLWWRATLLFDTSATDPYALLVQLGEDEMVQIMERPSLAGNRRLTRQVARELFCASAKHPDIPRRVLIREAQKRLMRLAMILSFDVIDDREMEQTVKGIFEKVAKSVRSA